MSTGPDAVPGEITMLLSEARTGNPGAIDDLFALVYDELRQMARQGFERAGGNQSAHGLDGTALVHAACERLLGAAANTMSDGSGADAATSAVVGAGARAVGSGGRVLDAINRRHFFFMFQRAMHDALVAHVRSESAQKRGGGRERIGLIEFEADGDTFAVDILDLRSALEELRQTDPDGAQVIMLRFFGGRSLEETAAIMECTFATARRHWEYARAWLHERLSRPRAAN